MAHSPERLVETAARFISSMNARDYATARSLYADSATYQSAALVDADRPSGLLEGRDEIIGYFEVALDGDDDFGLDLLDVFTGVDMAVAVSSAAGRTFIDVLRTSDHGLIIEHREVSPKASPVGPTTTD